MRFVTRPLTQAAKERLGDTRHRQRSPFAYNNLYADLERELRHLNVTGEVVVMLNCAESDIRLDGMLKINARTFTADAGLAFTAPELGDLLYVCGTYDTWQGNLRAITHTLDAQRRIARYGAAKANEQYRGWQALPPATPMGSAMTVEQAAALLSMHGNWEGTFDIHCDGHVDLAFKRAVKIFHPDMERGDPETFRRLVEARDLLKGTA